MKLIHLYEKLLAMYPRSYRDDYADEMSHMLQSMIADEQQVAKRIALWTRAFAELPILLFMANLHVLEAAYTSSAPGYVVRSTRVSTALVTPFVLLVIFNELRPGKLPNSPNAIDILQFFAIGLPLIAFLLSIAALLRWSIARHKSSKDSFIKGLTDIKHNWPLALVGVFAFTIVTFMVGHDSMQCLNGNPIKEVRNFNTTVQCISQN
jgi:hypothetical protein